MQPSAYPRGVLLAAPSHPSHWPGLGALAPHKAIWERSAQAQSVPKPRGFCWRRAVSSGVQPSTSRPPGAGPGHAAQASCPAAPCWECPLLAGPANICCSWSRDPAGRLLAVRTPRSGEQEAGSRAGRRAGAALSPLRSTGSQTATPTCHGCGARSRLGSAVAADLELKHIRLQTLTQRK